jgi:DNA-directed RNA polymerase I subunit RPA43
MSAQPNAVASSSSSKPKSHKTHKSKPKDKDRKDKGKHKEKSEKTGPFEHRTSRLRLSIPPRYGADYLAGVKDILNGMLMR